MSKSIVVIVHRDRYCWPKLTITVERRCKNTSTARTYITNLIMSLYDKRCRVRFGPLSSMRVKEYRIVDEIGLKRLQAAAKASVTLRRKKGAQKAAKTRARNLAMKQFA